MGTTLQERQLVALRPRLLRRARRYRRDPSAAEDLVQDALLKVWLRLRKEPPVAEVEAYVTTAMRRLAARGRAPEMALEDAPEPSEDAEAPRRIAASQVISALSHLPPDQQDLLRGLALAEDSYEALARRHNLPLGTVMSRIARGRAALRTRLGLPDATPVEALLDR